MVGDDTGIPLRAVFPSALLCLEVDIEDAEALLITEAPFKVIHERPEVVALNVHAFIVQIGDGFEVLADVVDPVIVMDFKTPTESAPSVSKLTNLRMCCSHPFYK